MAFADRLYALKKAVSGEQRGYVAIQVEDLRWLVELAESSFQQETLPEVSDIEDEE